MQKVIIKKLRIRIIFFFTVVIFSQIFKLGFVIKKLLFYIFIQLIRGAK